MTFPSEQHREVVSQTIAELAQGHDEQTRERVELFIGNAKTATESPESFQDAIKSGSNSDFFADLSKLTDGEIRHLVGAKGLTDWMLYLHPDQQSLVQKEYAGPARVIGVSGSGKTSLLVHRARYLAKKYPEERILILSLNATLCNLIVEMLNALCEAEFREHITVMTIYEFCYKAVKTIGPDRLIEKHDPRSGEDLVACWRDFMQKTHARKTGKAVLDALDCHQAYFDSRSYVREELIWIRSGFGRDDRQQYLSCQSVWARHSIPKIRPGNGPEATPRNGRCNAI